MTGHSGPERESRSCDCTACDADRMQKLSVPGVLQAKAGVRGVCAAVGSTATHTAVLRKAILRTTRRSASPLNTAPSRLRLLLRLKWDLCDQAA